MSEKKIKIDWGIFFTLSWLLFWFSLLMKGFNKEEGFGGLGAYISGVFSPLALYWFYIAYKLQSNALDRQVEQIELNREELTLQRQSLEKQVEELGLSREELSLQRKALEAQVEELKHSVEAQQGSRKALSDQSQVLQRQLKITSKQFEHYLQDREDKRPSFEVINCHLFTKLKEGTLFSHSGMLVYGKIPDFCRVILANHKADCIVKSVQVIKTNHNLKIDVYPSLELKEDSSIDPFRKKYNDKTEYITFKVTANLLDASPSEYRKLVIEKLEWTIFIVNYSYADTSSHDVYEFYLDNDELKARLLEGD